MNDDPESTHDPSFDVQTASHPTITVCYEATAINIGQAKALGHALAHAHGQGYNGYTPEVILSYYGKVGTAQNLQHMQRWIFEGTGI